MTQETKKNYEKDVKKFYKVFSGQGKVPNTIKKFSQIPLKDFQKSEGCKYNYQGKPEGVYNKKYIGTLKENLFNDYANHIKVMMQTTTTNQNKLLKIIDELFAFNINPKTNRKEIEINPNLNEENLQKLVIKTRDIITNLYLTCENEFIKGIEIFEAIVEKQMMDTTINHIKSLEQNLEELNIIPDEQEQNTLETNKNRTQEEKLQQTDKEEKSNEKLDDEQEEDEEQEEGEEQEEDEEQEEEETPDEKPIKKQKTVINTPEVEAKYAQAQQALRHAEAFERVYLERPPDQ